MEPITTRLLAVVFLMMVTLANVEGTTCYLCTYSGFDLDTINCLNPTSSTPTCSTGTQCFNAFSSDDGGLAKQITRGCASGVSTLGCTATDYGYQNTSFCFCSGDLCNTGSTAPAPSAPSDGPETTCYLCSYINTSPDTSNCLNPSSSTPTCSTGTQCIDAFGSVSSGGTYKELTRGCASGAPLGCTSAENNYDNSTFCVCSGDLCNTGSTNPALANVEKTTCYLCSYSNTIPDTSNCLNPSSSTPTCSTGTQCSNEFLSSPGGEGVTYYTQIVRACASGAPLGCETGQNINANGTLCVCSSDLCNTASSAPTQDPNASPIGGSATPAPNTPASTQVPSDGLATHVGVWNLLLLAFTAVASFALAQGNLL